MDGSQDLGRDTETRVPSGSERREREFISDTRCCVVEPNERVGAISKDDFRITEYKEALEMYRTEFSVWTQTTMALALANVSVLGFAVNSGKAGLFLVGSMISAMILIGYEAARRYLSVIAYRAVVLEEEHGDGSQSLASTMVGVFFSPQHVARLKQIGQIEDATTRILQLRQVRGSLSRKGVLLLLGAALVQTLLVPLLVLVFSWPFA